MVWFLALVWSFSGSFYLVAGMSLWWDSAALVYLVGCSAGRG